MGKFWKRKVEGECEDLPGNKKKVHGTSTHAVWKKLLWLQRKLARSLSQIRIILARQNSRIHALQEQVNDLQGATSNVLAFLRGRLNTRVTIETTAGSVFGMLIAIGEDYAHIAEPNGSIVIVPIRSFLSVA